MLLGRKVLRALEHHVPKHVGDAPEVDALFLGFGVVEDLDRGEGRLDRRSTTRSGRWAASSSPRPAWAAQRRRRRGAAAGAASPAREATRSPARSAAAALGPGGDTAARTMTPKHRGGNRLLSSDAVEHSLVIGLVAAKAARRRPRSPSPSNSFVTHAGEGAAGSKRFMRDGCYQIESGGSTGARDTRATARPADLPADVAAVFARLGAIAGDALVRDDAGRRGATGGARADGLLGGAGDARRADPNGRVALGGGESGNGRRHPPRGERAAE